MILRRPSALPAVGLALALLLGACGQGGQVSQDGQDAAETSGDGEQTSPRAGSDRLQEAAEAGMERAASFGFDTAGFYTEDAVEEFREQMAESPPIGEADPDVRPASCAEPLVAVDWAPLLLDTDVVRVDFGSETFTGTGSIEIASVGASEDSSRVREHMEHVSTLVESCEEVSVTQMETSYELEFEPVATQGLTEVDDQGEGTVGYIRTRALSGEQQDGMIVAQILFTREDEDLVMVSFIGEPAAGSQEFTEIAEAITEETLESLQD